jgi:hypothetical protein
MDVWQVTRTQLTPLSRASKTPEGNLAPLQHMRPVFVSFIGGSSSFNGDETRDVRIAPTFLSGLSFWLPGQHAFRTETFRVK